MSEVTVDAHLLVYADRSAQCAAYFTSLFPQDGALTLIYTYPWCE